MSNVKKNQLHITLLTVFKNVYIKIPVSTSQGLYCNKSEEEDETR